MTLTSATHIPDGATIPTLATTLDRFAEHEDLDASVGSIEADWWTADRLMRPASSELDELLKVEAERCPGLDVKGECAFLIGDSAYYLSLVLAGLYLAERQVPELTPARLAMRVRWLEWHDDGESGTYPQLGFRFLTPHFWTDRHGRLPLGGRTVLGDDELRATLRQQLEHFYLPLLVQLHGISRLSKGAGWRLIADALAAAFLQVGRELGCESYAKEEAIAIIRCKDSLLYNRQTGFFDVRVTDPDDPERILVTRSFRARGGCCRYYTCEQGQLCSTCVLEKPEVRNNRLRDWLWQQFQQNAEM